MIDFNLALENEQIFLRPLEYSDLYEMYGLTKDPEMWFYFTSDLSVLKDLESWIDEAVKERNAKKRLAFVVIEKLSGKIIGSTSLGNYSERDRRIEIGWTWIGKEFQGKTYNIQAKDLMLEYCFRRLELERVEAKTDVLNVAARISLSKAGFIEEGILRSHTLLTNNRRRNTIFYSVLKDEYLKKSS